MNKSALAVLLLVLALFGAACSSQVSVESTEAPDTTTPPTFVDDEQAPNDAAQDDSAQTDAAPDDSAQNDVAENDSTETDAAADDAEDTEAPTESAAAPTVDTPSPASSAGSDDWCSVARQVEDSFEEDGLSLFDDPEGLEQAYRSFNTLLQGALPLAPPAIAGDVAATAEAVATMTDLLESAGWDFLAIDISTMDAITQGMAISGYNIEKYNFDVCGIGEDPGTAPIDPDVFPDDDDAPVGTLGDLLIDGYIEAGFTEAEAICLADKLDLTDPEALADVNAIMGLFGECGIALDRLSQLGG